MISPDPSEDPAGDGFPGRERSPRRAGGLSHSDNSPAVPEASLRFEVEGWPRPGTRRTLALSAKRRRFGLFVGGFLLAVGFLVLGGLPYLVAEALRARALTQTVAQLEQERYQVAGVLEDLAEMEAQFARLRELFSEGVPLAEPLWLPPPGIGPARAPAPPPERLTAEPPSLWPLTERGFLSRGLVVVSEEASRTAHPGIDLAVPSGSYFRAIGEGVVAERGEDPVYGLFVVVEHPLGYRSLYAHASVVVVEPGQSVRPGQVLGLTGSSGLSTAPHLHLEITRDGVHLDPLELLQRP